MARKKIAAVVVRATPTRLVKFLLIAARKFRMGALDLPPPAGGRPGAEHDNKRDRTERTRRARACPAAEARALMPRSELSRIFAVEGETKMTIRIGIMGFGRIGRNVFRILYSRDDIEIVAIVDIADPKGLEYLLKFDTVHGRFDEPVWVTGDSMYAKGRQIRMLQRKAPGDVDWGAMGVDIVIESTGQYRTRETLEKHLAMGAKRVILTVPPRDEVDALVVMGVNDGVLTPETRIVSNASCTANALAPICKVLNDGFGIEKAFMTTVHAYTNDQRLADVPHTELRRSRAAAENIIPATTWSPMAVEKIVPELKGRLDGMALNVPVPDGSIVDLVTLMKRPVTAEEVNEVVKSAAATRFKTIIEYVDQPIVSSDVIGNPHSAIFDGLSTQVLGGNLLKTLTWYDNGWGYATRVVELVLRLAKFNDLAAPAGR
jgi:glyceraldehyde 3-phosphate dehydrogenase